jgi:hypothetical protein
MIVFGCFFIIPILMLLAQLHTATSITINPVTSFIIKIKCQISALYVYFKLYFFSFLCYGGFVDCY